MKKTGHILLLFVLLAAVLGAGAQTANDTPVRWVPVLPSACSLTKPQALVYKYTSTSGAIGLYRCSGGVYVPVGGGTFPSGSRFELTDGSSLSSTSTGAGLLDIKKTFTGSAAIGFATIRSLVNVSSVTDGWNHGAFASETSFNGGLIAGIHGIGSTINLNSGTAVSISTPINAVAQMLGTSAVTIPSLHGTSITTNITNPNANLTVYYGMQIQMMQTGGTVSNERAALHLKRNSAYSHGGTVTSGQDFAIRSGMREYSSLGGGLSIDSATDNAGASFANKVPFKVHVDAANHNTNFLEFHSGGAVFTPGTIKFAVDKYGRPRIGSEVPATAADTCTAGTVTYDADFVYICVAADTWKRSALSTW